jgi:hypothetical protein
MVPSNHQKCYRRDSNIFSLLYSCGALNTDQLKILAFADTSLQFAQDKLKRLYKAGRVNRDRYSMSEPFYYWPIDTKRPKQEIHLIGVNWIYSWITLGLGQWEIVHSYERELDYKILRTDGLIGVKNVVKKSIDFWFLEFDRVQSGNCFDKVPKYTALYLSGSYTNTWWGKVAVRFPGVIVVTTGKAQRIQEHIDKENSESLRFKVYSLNQIKEECFYGRSR